MPVQVICHGGAWSIPDQAAAESQKGVREAAKAGLEALKNGQAVEDAVVAAVSCMENNPIFNAGFGASLTRAGTVELDSMIMRGRDLEIGAVAGVQKIKNACQLARKVLDSEHTMIISQGAVDFAVEQGIDLVDPDSLVTDYEKAALKKLQDYKPAVKNIFGDQHGHDTVGAVAVDSQGNFAACTSTGGVTFKRVGRVGDSPLAGSGAWADEFGACSTTGHGEGITKALLAKRVVDECQKEDSPSKAVKNGLDYMLNRIGSRGGAITLTKDNYGFSFNTKRMPWCHVTLDAENYGMNPNEHFTADIK